MRANPNFDVIKEPRGFIKCLEVFLAIFAFSCATGYRGSFSFNQHYPLGKSNASHQVSGSFKYPFAGSITLHVWDNGTIKPIHVKIDERSSTEFFVVVGVFCFLYCLLVLVYYVMFEEDSSKSETPTSTTFTPPVIDFVAGAFWAFFWFVSACAQAAAVNGIKDATDAANFIQTSQYCKNPVYCDGLSKAKYATLTVSFLLGFLNVFVWAGNMWFLWKETPWHNRGGAQQAATVQPPQHQPTPPAAAI